jgi:hypothetical protein
MPREEKINCRVIIEMLGAPKEHIEETIRSYVKQLKEEYKTVKVLREQFAEAKKRDKLYSTFVELDLEVQGAENLIGFCFDYMPSSVEIFEPEMLTYEAQDFTDFLNDLQGKLHKIDMALKNLSAENQILKKNNSIIVRSYISHLLKNGPKKLEELSQETSIKPDALDKIMMALLQDKTVKYADDVYSLA